MSKEEAGVAVGVFFNIAVAVAPNVSDEHKRIAFYCTIPLLILAILWWLLAHFKGQKKRAESEPQASTVAHDVTHSAIATAARDVHQTIHHHALPITPEIKQELPDFFYDGNGSAVSVRAFVPPGGNRSLAEVKFNLRFVNRSSATAYSLGYEIYGCWIHDEPLKAIKIDTATSVGRTFSGEAKHAVLFATREWETPTGIHSLNIRKNHIVILVEINFRVGSSEGPIRKNEPIWITWTPELRQTTGDSTLADIGVAKPLIDELKAANYSAPIKKGVEVRMQAGSTQVEVCVINHDEVKPARLHSVRIYRLKDGQEMDIGLDGTGIMKALPKPCVISPEGRRVFPTRLMLAALGASGASAYVAEVELEAGAKLRSNVYDVAPA